MKTPVARRFSPTGRLGGRIPVAFATVVAEQRTGIGRRDAAKHCALALCALLIGCTTARTFPAAAPPTGKRSPPEEHPFQPSDVAKGDIDAVADALSRECLASARLLMAKLYRRNPREWRKGRSASSEAALARAFDPRFEFRFAEIGDARGVAAIVLALKPQYAGDRVFAFGVGLASMVFLAYGEKTQFYVTDSLDPQRLYNSARNIEIAAWKLANARGPRGEPLLLSNEVVGDVKNISFEREFGKMIAYQDAMADIAAQRTNRIIRRVLQSVATAVFLPM